MTELRLLPSIDKLLGTEAVRKLIAEHGRPLTLEALRATLEGIRGEMLAGGRLPPVDAITDQAGQTIRAWITPTLKPVINGSGVIIHTNLGRAPLSRATLQAMDAIAQGYSNLEYDLDKGRRGSRLVHAGDLLVRLTGAEAALVVNNNAAAVLLVLTALSKRRRTLISRTQLVEIGGGFRIPDVMAQSGAKLVEIGTTNRVHLRDYQQALEEQPIKLVMWAHRSNFAIIGFHTEPGIDEVAAVAHGTGIPLVEDLGSGTLIETATFGLSHEPTIQESLAAGADLVTFSGDKLLGGPQAGLIVGRADLVRKLKTHPLARALRADKLALAGLSATLLHYVKDEALEEIPVWRMISTSETTLQDRVSSWIASLGVGTAIRGESAVGGGSLPGQTLPTILLALEGSHLTSLLAELRETDPPVIARIQEDRLVIDPRTVLPEQDALLVATLSKVFS